MKKESKELEQKKASVSRQLRNMIEEEIYLPGAALPTERELSGQYDLSRMAVKEVLQELVEDGFIYRIQGKGTFVQKKIPDRASLGLLSAHGGSFSKVMKRQGIKIENQMIGKGIVPATPFLREKLGLEEGDEIYGIYRIRVGNQVPYAVEYSYLPLKYFEDIDSQNFSEVSLYAYMRAKSYAVDSGPQQMILQKVYGKSAEYLRVEEGTAVYHFEFTGRTRNGITVEYTESYVRPDKTELRVQSV